MYNITFIPEKIYKITFIYLLINENDDSLVVVV